MRVKLKPLQHVLAFYKFACQLHDVACQVSERRCFSTHPGDEFNNDPRFTSRKLVAARWNHCRKKLGPNIGRASVHENKNQTFVVFLSILTFAYLLGIVFDLFVPFGRTVETQNVLQRWFWRLRGVWPIFVTCRSSLDLSSEFGRVLQGFFFFFL
jgi:hypothetical protein